MPSEPHEPHDDRDADLPDPYAHMIVTPPPPAPPPPPRAELSALAVGSVLVAILLGPVGAILAIVLGWHARREIENAGARRSGYGLATLGMVLGVALTPAWGGVLSYLAWTHTHRTDPAGAPVADEPDPPSLPPRAPLVAPAQPQPPAYAPKQTHTTREGRVVVVDVGLSTASLPEELARQRAEAAAEGRTLLLMTTALECKPCRGVDRSLSDPLMQNALAGVRLVRVDVVTFDDDLDQIRVPHDGIPGFFLLGPDLTPRDGIDGDEWGDDVAVNIAPVLGAFLRGKYATRHSPWRPLPTTGVAL